MHRWIRIHAFAVTPIMLWVTHFVIQKCVTTSDSNFLLCGCEGEASWYKMIDMWEHSCL